MTKKQYKTYTEVKKAAKTTTEDKKPEQNTENNYKTTRMQRTKRMGYFIYKIERIQPGKRNPNKNQNNPLVYENKKVKFNSSIQ